MFSRKFAPTDILLILVLAALAAFIISSFRRQSRSAEKYASPVGAQEITGAAIIDDGDSLKINGRRIRLVGIDAPELHQNCEKGGAIYACGAIAKEHMRALIAGRQVRCRWAETDKYHRLLGHCYAGETDLNRSMVIDGWAVDYSYASDGDNHYKREERAARAAKRGIWAGTFERPKNWRKHHPRY